jgi:hypothetical protein
MVLHLWWRRLAVLTRECYYERVNRIIYMIKFFVEKGLISLLHFVEAHEYSRVYTNQIERTRTFLYNSRRHQLTYYNWELHGLAI